MLSRHLLRRAHVRFFGISLESLSPIALTVFLCLASSHFLFGQATGRISGTVLDASGGVVPAANVTCTNVETGVIWTAPSNTDGNFVFPDLPIGQYTINVEKQGFQTQRTSPFTLVTGQVLDLQLALKVGDVSQSVEVSAESTLIQTTSSSVQASVTEKQMMDLPLNGRNPLQLTTLTPGTVITDVGTDSGQEDNRGLSVNGLRVTQNNYQLDGALYTNRFFDSAPTLPNPDALEEFTIQTSGFSAEYSGAGALVQLSTRSGSNELHGTLFEFLRNTELDARNFFQIVRPPFKLNQFGGTVGGPIRKNKTFYFVSVQDESRRSSPSPVSVTVPTAAEHIGNFSALASSIYDPTTAKPFPGNIIPTARLDPVSVKVANADLPLPNSGTQWVGNAPQNLDDHQYLGKLDQLFGGNNHFSARYYYDEDDFQRPMSAPSGFFAENSYLNQTATVEDTQIFSPTLTAAFYASFNRNARTQVPEAPGMQSLQDFGQQVPLGTSVPIFPGIRCNIYGDVNIFSGGALRQDPTSFYYKASVAKIWGQHTISAGVEFERSRIDVNDYSYTPGDNTFVGQFSGNVISDFYLGAEYQFYQDNGRRLSLREDRPDLFVQDDWKVSHRFTLNLGLRWEPWLAPDDLNNALVAYVPGAQSKIAPNAPLGLLFPGDSGVQSSVFKHDWKDFAPRVGFAYNVGSATVIRGAYGIFYSFPGGLLYQRTDATQPTDLYLSIPGPPSFDNPYQGFSGGDPFPRPHMLPSQFANYQFILPLSGGVLDPSSKVGYTQNWNLTLERQLRKDLAISVAYVGNHGVDIMASRQMNPALYYPGATVAAETSHRLYPGLGAVEVASSFVYAEYNALQVNVTKRTNKGLTLLSNFVWSKTIDNTSTSDAGDIGPPDPFNFRSARGPADFDQEYRFTLSAVYNTPHIAVEGVKSVLLNNWQINTIASLDSGLPFTILSGQDRSFSGIGNDYADEVGNAARPAGVNQLQEYFNTAAYQLNAIGTFGNGGRNNLRGPVFFDVDMSIFKNFPLKEKRYIQFRAESFNTENRPNFQNPTANLSSGTFGRITAAYDPRVLQFALKLFF